MPASTSCCSATELVARLPCAPGCSSAPAPKIEGTTTGSPAVRTSITFAEYRPSDPRSSTNEAPVRCAVVPGYIGNSASVNSRLAFRNEYAPSAPSNGIAVGAAIHDANDAVPGLNVSSVCTPSCGVASSTGAGAKTKRSNEAGFTYPPLTRQALLFARALKLAGSDAPHSDTSLVDGEVGYAGKNVTGARPSCGSSGPKNGSFQ